MSISNPSAISQALLNEIYNVSKEKDIPVETVRDFLTDSIKKAFSKSTYEDNLEVTFDLDSGELKTYKLYEVIDDSNELDEYINISINDPKLKDSNLKVGDFYKEFYDITKEFKQNQVQQILQSFKQKIIEVSNQRVYKAWTPMIGQVILAEIEKEDKKSGFFTVNLENKTDFNGMPLENTLGFIGKKELNPLEDLDVGKKYHFVVSEVKEQSKYCPVILSRASEKLVEYYMNLEIPEIDDGSIKIVKIARIAGVKTKVLVDTKTLPVEPAAICVGPKGSRVKTISNLLGGEKIEIYNYNEDPVVLISEILDKSKMVGLALEHDENGNNSATVVVQDASLPQIIGKKGSNVRLASLISDWNINIITQEEADYDDLKYMKVTSPEYKNHFKKVNATATTSNVDESELDILSLNDNDIDEMINNANLDTLVNDHEEDLNYDLLDSEELNDLNDVFGDEVKNALNKK